jgi:hypothetical protein
LDTNPNFFFEVKDEIEKAKNFLFTELSNSRKVRPFVTFFRFEIPLFSVYLPLVDTAEERIQSLRNLTWLNSVVGSNTVFFAIDSSINMVTLTGEDKQQDVYLLFLSNKAGAFVYPLCYNYSSSNNSIEWLEDLKIEDQQVLENQPEIVAFLASQFFLEPKILPFDAYVSFLKEKGCEFTFYEPLSEELIPYAISTFHDN